MEITDIAQIVTGIATLVVALILVSQLYQQHKDTEIQLTMDSWQLNQSLILAEINDADLSKILSKSDEGLDNLTREEEVIFNKWLMLKMGRLSTEWRLGRMSNDPRYYKIHLSNFFSNKGVLEAYENFARQGTIDGTVWKPGFVDIVDEVYARLSKTS
ncbi:MAG: hypothetical protein P8J64_04070 [Dehalococcoidia bacterium]|nr:hypothetical protein [Dehalococcoidia bacterium]